MNWRSAGWRLVRSGEAGLRAIWRHSVRGSPRTRVRRGFLLHAPVDIVRATAVLKADPNWLFFPCAWPGHDPPYIDHHDREWVYRSMRAAPSGIIRSKVKINAALNNARAYLKLRAAGQEFSTWVRSFTNGAPMENAWKAPRDVPPVTPLAIEISKARNAKGFRFAGPVTVYAWMQAVRLVNDYIVPAFVTRRSNGSVARRRGR
jgi:3-methyladenine DNA glycosylase Tag